MWLIGVEVEQETSAPPPKKILDPPLDPYMHRGVFAIHTGSSIFFEIYIKFNF